MRFLIIACLVCTFLCSFLVSGMKVPLNQDRVAPEKVDVRVINGQNAGEYEIPWQVAVRRVDGKHYCGGSILSKYWVLSAAHYFFRRKPERYLLHFGAYATSGKTSLEETRKIKKVFLHPDYDDRSFRHDFALILLDKPLEFNKAIQPIALPKAESRVPTGKKCLLSGWGYKVLRNRKYADILQKTTLSIADENLCSRINGRLSVDHESMLCAGELGKTGGCYGDGGGPLACNEGGKWVLRGVDSWGGLGCSLDRYTVFARVSHAINWIQAEVEEVCKTA